MMLAPDKPIFLFSQAYHRQAHQRRATEIHQPFTVRFQSLSNLSFLQIFWNISEINTFNRQVNRLQNNLHRLALSVRGKQTPQNRMPRHNLLPCLMEGSEIKCAFQCHGDLAEILVSTRLQRAVEEYSL